MGLTWAHPRSRGENVVAAREELLLDGSSPLTRGKRHPELFSDGQGGLIPAHAGKTVFLRSQEGNRRAHPRSRGENIAVTIAPIGFMGSSPLTRGKLDLRAIERRHRGLIPAHAGKTSRTPP